MQLGMIGLGKMGGNMVRRLRQAGLDVVAHDVDHTVTRELAEETGAGQVVMMLATRELRVALATTHLALSAVPAAITPGLIERTLRTLHADLVEKFAIAEPCIAVLGLNPHAGEGGHMGREEIEVIIPVLERLRAEGMDLLGPLPADTATTWLICSFTWPCRRVILFPR